MLFKSTTLIKDFTVGEDLLMASLLRKLFLRLVQARCGNGTVSVEEDILILSEEAGGLGGTWDGPASPQMEETLGVRSPVEETVVLPLLEMLFVEESP